MDKETKAKLLLLRQQIPIGLQHGLTLLEKTKGNLEQAILIFQEEKVLLLVSKTGVGKEVARRHLIQSNYDLTAAITRIDEERYSLTERILKKYYKKEDALRLIAGSVEKAKKLHRNFWLDFEALKELEPEIFAFMVIQEWLLYEDYEGLSSAVYFHFETVAEQIEQQLAFPLLTQTLRKTKSIHHQQYEQQRSFLEREGYRSATPEFLEQEKLYKSQKPLLIDKLYDFVKKHIHLFP